MSKKKDAIRRLLLFFAVVFLMYILTGSNNKPDISLNMNSINTVQDRHNFSISWENFCIENQCLAPYQKYKLALITSAPKYKIANCGIPKSLSTISTAILCYLYDPNWFINQNKSIPDQSYDTRHCKGKNEGRKQNLNQLHSNKWINFVVVRHPLDRLISGFMDKCVRLPAPKDNPHHCFGCKRNITCLIIRSYNKFLTYIEKPSIQPKDSGWTMEDHFYPQSWFCLFDAHLQDYIVLKYPTRRENFSHFYDNLSNLFAKNNIPDSLLSIMKAQLTTKMTSHSTSGLKSASYYRDAIMKNSHLLNIVIKMYYYDFLIFGFELPLR